MQYANWRRGHFKINAPTGDEGNCAYEIPKLAWLEIQGRSNSNSIFKRLRILLAWENKFFAASLSSNLHRKQVVLGKFFARKRKTQGTWRGSAPVFDRGKSTLFQILLPPYFPTTLALSFGLVPGELCFCACLLPLVWFYWFCSLFGEFLFAELTRDRITSPAKKLCATTPTL